MASDPYCAAAPSRSTSMFLTMADGIVFRSTAAAPRPIDWFRLISDDVWRRLEFTSTRLWSGAMPRRVAGRTVSVPSVSVGRGKFSEGRATDSAWFSSVEPVVLRVSAEMMSTGDAVSSAVRLATRVPVTTTVEVPAAGAASWARAGPANSAAMETASTVWCGMNRCCISWSLW